MSNTPQAKYVVDFTINVQRTDGQRLTPAEDAMVEKMRDATHAAIEAVMILHGQHTLAKQDRTVKY